MFSACRDATIVLLDDKGIRIALCSDGLGAALGLGDLGVACTLGLLLHLVSA